MGLTHQSTGAGAAGGELQIIRNTPEDRVVALAGNPNVGKSTVFNALTKMNQHTGNWPGKTVTNAQGSYQHNGRRVVLVDVPGTYSLMASSVEEEVARDFICFGGADAIAIVADATCLERNLNLILQILEVTNRAVVCVNLLDEAKKKKLHVDLSALSTQLGVPVVGASAREGEGLDVLKDEIFLVSTGASPTSPFHVRYDGMIEQAVSLLQTAVVPVLECCKNRLPARWLCLKLLDMDDNLRSTLAACLELDLVKIPAVAQTLEEVTQMLAQQGISRDQIRDKTVSSLVKHSETIYHKCVQVENQAYNNRDRKLDKLLTSKRTGIPIMIALLALIFWLTIVGANYPSALLGNLLFGLQDKLAEWLAHIHTPLWLNEMLTGGIYRTLAWVVSVMLPPMAIFFPLFTLLEDSGYLPRIAFNMDKFFKKAHAHGKQALTMCMGFGCNACGVVGCRIIDSPRERLIAILTNNFVPCNGRFPTLIAIITIFFTGAFVIPAVQSVFSALLLLAVVLLGVGMTLLMSRLLSKTVLKGMPSSFALELPPYRRPQIGKVIVRSIFDRTLFVLGRAVAVAAPAGLIIWLFANLQIGENSVLSYCTGFLDPFARLLGLDGTILMAFILGFPANEIVLPIIIMSYLCTGTITDFASLDQLRLLLLDNGWTWVTALCFMLFSLLHFPCGTTCWTILKETKSWKWTALAFALPTATGMVLCALVSGAARLFGIG